ncbi:MAG: AAA family ATPase [Actinomycetota bacterium]
MTKKKKRNVAPVIPGTDRTSRPRPSERVTRAPMAMWDRVKFLLLLGILWLSGLAVVWAASVNPLGGPFSDAVRIAFNDYAWILILAAIEFVRQLHYWLEEHSKGYFRFWEKKVFGSAQGLGRGIDDWTRFRLARAIKFFIVLLALSTFMGRLFNTDPVWLGIVEAPARLVIALPFILQLAFGFFFVMFQFVGLFWFLSRGGIDTIMPDEIETRFDDVKGQDAALGQLKETLVFLDDPEAIESRGGYVPGGILLWGPPGTGKTLMAQAVAGETAKPFVNVDAGAFINMFMGVGILKVRSLYRKLRKLSMRYGGAIVFIDEADSLGSRGQQAATGYTPVSPWTTAPTCNGLAYISEAGRDSTFHAATAAPGLGAPYKEQVIMGGMGMGGGGMGTLQALLAEMSGLTKPKGLVNKIRKLLGMKPKPPPKYRILHIFATNMPNTLDPAMLRPGRVDRQYKVGYPQKDGRRATFDYYLAKVSNDLSDEQVDKLATITPYFSGASIKDIVNEGLVIAIRDDRDTLSFTDVVKAKQLKQHGLPDDHEYIERERHSVAVHEACHAIVAYRLRKHAVIDMATIERRGDVGGFVSSIPPEDQFVQWRTEREIDVMTALASLAGERMFFDGDHSMGVGGDMNAATAMTTQALAFYAMGDTLASRSVTLAGMRGAQALETGADRAMFDSTFGHSVESKLGVLYERTWDLLQEHRGEVLALAHALEAEKTITGDDVEAIIEGTPGPTVDGRPYHDPSFRQMLERYHEAVLRAHKKHAGVEARIPVPVPPPPVDVSAGAGNGQAARPELRLGPPSPPRPDDT